jgi:hypothetical protein
MIEIIDDRRVSEHFNVVIAYGDMSGLNDDDDQYYDDWISQFGKNDYPICDGIDEPVWAKCDITGLMGNCVLVKIARYHDE